MISNTDLKGAAALAPIVTGVGARPTALEFDLAHHLPGRLRLRSTALKGNGQAIQEARRHLAQLRGVTSRSLPPLLAPADFCSKALFEPGRRGPGQERPPPGGSRAIVCG